jgi:hypothetical protein
MKKYKRSLNKSGKKNKSGKVKRKSVKVKRSKSKKKFYLRLFDGTKRKREEEERIITLDELLLMDHVGVLSLRNFTTFNYTIEVKFAILNIFFIIYNNYRNNSELSVDLIKKLKVYYCMQPEKLQEELVGLLPINDQLLQVTGQISQQLKDLIRDKRNNLEQSVINIELVKNNTETVNPEKINVLDCDILSPIIIAQNTVIYVNKDQLRVISDQKV